MAQGEYRVHHFNMYSLPQDTGVTCWAACVATARACKERRFYTETEALPQQFRGWYTTPRTLTLSQIRSVYRTMGLTEGDVNVSDRPGLVQLIRQHAPIIVGHALANPDGTHRGYHVRLINGYWGDPDAADENRLQIRIFDPAPDNGMWETPFLFSHFRYQMTHRTGPVPDIVGKIWYY